MLRINPFSFFVLWLVIVICFSSNSQSLCRTVERSRPSTDDSWTPITPTVNTGTAMMFLFIFLVYCFCRCVILSKNILVTLFRNNGGAARRRHGPTAAQCPAGQLDRVRRRGEAALRHVSFGKSRVITEDFQMKILPFNQYNIEYVLLFVSERPFRPIHSPWHGGKKIFSFFLSKTVTLVASFSTFLSFYSTLLFILLKSVFFSYYF